MSELLKAENLENIADLEEIKEPEAPAAAPAEQAIAEEPIPAPAAVPADLGEIERENRGEGDARISAKPNRQRVRPTPAPQTNSQPQREEPGIMDDIGTYSEDLMREDSVRKSQAEIDDENYRKMQTYCRNKEILWGTVYAVEETDAWKNTIVIAVLYNGVKVLIPDFEYFDKTYDFGANYKYADDEQKMRRRQVVAQYQLGARVCFVLSAVSRHRIEHGQFADEYITDAVGSRKEALDILRDIYFFHEKRKRTNRAPRTVNVGDVQQARVLAVREDYALVECVGVESRIDAQNLTDTMILSNCHDYVKPGDVINVRIRRIYIDKNKNIYLALSGRLNDVNKEINLMRANNWYLGHVDKYNVEKGIYTIKLKNGVSAAVNKHDVEGGIELNIGDRVKVFVYTIKETHVSGKAMKL